MSVQESPEPRLRGPAWLQIALLCALACPLPGGFALAQDRLSTRPPERLFLDDVAVGSIERSEIRLYLRAQTDTGQPAELLPPWPFEIREDGRRIERDRIEVKTLAESGEGVTCVLILDISPSMQTAIERARRAALDFVGRLRGTDQLAVVTVSASARVAAPFSASLSEKRARLETLQIDPEPAGTRLYDGIELALGELVRSTRLPRRALLLIFSDGRDGGSLRSLEDLLGQVVPGSSRGRVPIFAVSYPDPRFGSPDPKALRTLVRRSGAELLRDPSDYVLDAFLEDVWKQVLGSYVVRYPTDLDGSEHQVEVTLAGRVETRSLMYPQGPSRFPWRWLVAILVVALALLAPLLVLWVRHRAAGVLVLVGSGHGHGRFALRRGSNEIGALPENDIVLSSPTVSRYHAVLRVSRAGVEIEDRQSMNGTCVNDRPVQVSPLNPGDRIRLGDVELMYQR